MTTEQFEELKGLLIEINQNIKLITSEKTGGDVFGLSDVWVKIGDVESSIGSLKSSIGDVKNAIHNLDLG